MSDDLRARLEEAGRRPVPDPDPAFADRLEARLMAVAASLPPAAAQPPAAPPPSRRVRLRLALGGALLAGAALVALVVAIGTGPGRPVGPPELESPVNTQVALVDGTVLEDPDGLRLPEGAIVRVGEGGSARVGDTVLRPGDVATVEQGRLRVERGQPVGAVTSGRPSLDQSPGPARSTPPTRTPGHTPGPSRRPTTTPRPTDPPKSSATQDPALRSPTPVPTRDPATPAPTPSPPPTRSAPPPSATPTPSPAIVRPRLRARFVAPDGIRVTWTAVPGAGSYVLVATGSEVAPAPRPRYPGGRVIGTFPLAPATPLRFVVPAGIVEVRLLVVALAPDSTLIARSRVVILATGG